MPSTGSLALMMFPFRSPASGTDPWNSDLSPKSAPTSALSHVYSPVTNHSEKGNQGTDLLTAGGKAQSVQNHAPRISRNDRGLAERQEQDDCGPGQRPQQRQQGLLKLPQRDALLAAQSFHQGIDFTLRGLEPPAQDINGRRKGIGIFRLSRETDFGYLRSRGLLRRLGICSHTQTDRRKPAFCLSFFRPTPPQRTQIQARLHPTDYTFLGGGPRTGIRLGPSSPRRV